MVVYASICMCIYPIGAPLLLLGMLAAYRDRLNPDHTSWTDDLQHANDAIIDHSHELKVIARRKEDPVLAEEPITKFAMIYRPQFWYWEVVNTYRRLMLTCIVVLWETLAQTTTYVVFVSIISLILEREAKPYTNLFLSSFTYSGSWLIVLFVIYLLLLVRSYRR